MPTLIERLEAATWPNRELDAEIALATGWEFDPKFLILQWTSPDGQISKPSPPNFTSSIDAARSICKDAMVVQASEVGADGLPMVRLVTDTGTSPVIEYIGIASTIELAWCIAALRARGVE